MEAGAGVPRAGASLVLTELEDCSDGWSVFSRAGAGAGSGDIGVVGWVELAGASPVVWGVVCSWLVFLAGLVGVAVDDVLDRGGAKTPERASLDSPALMVNPRRMSKPSKSVMSKPVDARMRPPNVPIPYLRSGAAAGSSSAGTSSTSLSWVSGLD